MLKNDIAETRKEAISKGLRFYKSNSPCKFGNIDKRVTSTYNCACDDCRKKKSRAIMVSRKNDPQKTENALRANREWRNRNREKEIERGREWRMENPNYSRQWYMDNRDEKLAKNYEWTKNNKERYRELKRSYDRTPDGKAKMFCRNAIKILVNMSGIKKSSTVKMLGYNHEALKSHIENLFVPGMSWDNYGEWHIDHIIPISYYVKNGIHDAKVVNCLSNLRPLWASENIRKGNKLI